MATKRMLIDASHPEETRVVVVDGTRLEEYDVEVADRKQLKGNIYLAKVTRVEPSLQAAFVEYGGNRHGFLAFNEIHPDYYQIPIADRQALLAEQKAAETAVERGAEDAGGNGEPLEALGGDDDDEVERRRPRLSPRNYKIQEVIKRRQIMLVQVAKEERGNKGAALTTYLSLAGRYCVLMPNTSRGGGISRKITIAADRKRLKKIVGELEIPEGMAVIVRTAGSGRNKSEIKRDYEYLLRLWSSIRELTLSSMAPALVYEEGSLIKRSIRDHYGREIEEIIIQGDEEYRIAKEFMKLFIPSHAKRVKQYDDPEGSLFQTYQAEGQLDAMHQPIVHLKSGGYIVINPTEALVAIDVNSGRATRERHIEETALRTNIEAADEVARQLRLRDLAGLIVVDFIDMEVARYQGQVERRLKEAMKHDRARIQLGRISPFGLLELSRQRLRPSLLETSFETCPHCGGSGVRRTIASTALAILRRIEEEGRGRRSSAITVYVPTAVGLYLLNHKRTALSTIETRYGMTVSIANDDSLIPPDHRIERVKAIATQPEEEAVQGAAEDTQKDERPEVEVASGEREDGGKRSRRRRPRRRKRPDGEMEAPAEAVEPDQEAGDADASDQEPDRERDRNEEEERAADASRKRRRRGKRGGRRRSRTDAEIDSGMAPPEIAAGESNVPGAIPGEAGPMQTAENETRAASGDTEDAPPADAAGTLADASDQPSPSPRRSARGARGRRRSDSARGGARSGDAPAEAAIDDGTTEDAKAETIGGEGGAPAGAETEPKPSARRAPRARPARKTANDSPDPTNTLPPAEGPSEAPTQAVAAPSEAMSTADEQRSESIAAEAAERETADVGGEQDRYAGESRRRGWWQRLLE